MPTPVFPIHQPGCAQCRPLPPQWCPSVSYEPYVPLPFPPDVMPAFVPTVFISLISMMNVALRFVARYAPPFPLSRQSRPGERLYPISFLQAMRTHGVASLSSRQTDHVAITHVGISSLALGLRKKLHQPTPTRFIMGAGHQLDCENFPLHRARG